ncbi:hypothetical protein HDU90_007588 [Geranomyces variabilis]|nr:hypothetical protein HDU90_007588 [Geranomyces variabilis]
MHSPRYHLRWSADNQPPKDLVSTNYPLLLAYHVLYWLISFAALSHIMSNVSVTLEPERPEKEVVALSDEDRLEIEDTFQRAFDRSLTEAKPRYVALAVGNRPMSAEPAFSLTFKETEHAALRAH